MWLFVVVVLVFLLYLGFRKPRGYPPGPPKIPFIGYLPFLEDHLQHKQLWRLSSTYGPVVGLYFGMQPSVVVNGWEAVKEALLNDDLNGRPELETANIQYGKQRGIKFVEDELRKEQRRFTLHQFRKLGFGKKSHEVFVHEEARELVKEINEAEGSSLPGMLGVSSINILWAVMGGIRFDRSDSRLWDLVARLNKLFRAGEEAIDEHRATLDPDNPRDFIDIYLCEMEKQKNDPNTTFTEKQMLVTCSDIFSAGTETGPATVSFGILLMTLHPEVMEKVQKELDEVVGRSRFPSVEDRSKLVYTDAALNEVFRFRSAAPFTVPHKALRDTILQRFRIPAETVVLVNLYSVFMDPEYWGDPETFRPERFLNSDGSARKDERLIPFGKGRRVCLGESLARMTSFILFTTLLQHFTFSLDPAVPVPNTEGKSGFTLSPPEFRVFAKPRL